MKLKSEEKPEPSNDMKPGDDKNGDTWKVAHAAKMKAGAEKFRAAADAYEGAADTDSASALMKAESSGDEATACHAEGKASCMRMRGAAPGTDEQDDAPDSKRLPAPVPADARAVAAASGSSDAKAHAELAYYAALGRRVAARAGGVPPDQIEARLAFASSAMAALGESDPVRAKGVLGAKLELAVRASELQKKLGATQAVSEDAARVKLWEDAVRDRKFQLSQVFKREELAGGEVRRVYKDYAKAQNAAYPELAAFEAWIGSRVPEPGVTAAEPSTFLADAAEQRQQQAHALSKRDIERARRAGVDPSELAAVIARRQSGASGAPEGV